MATVFAEPIETIKEMHMRKLYTHIDSEKEREKLNQLAVQKVKSDGRGTSAPHTGIKQEGRCKPFNKWVGK